MHLMGQGHSEESAYAICNATLEAMKEPEEEKAPDLPEGAQAEPLTVTSVEPIKHEFERRAYVGEMKALKNGDVEAYVSTEAVDRVGDVVKAKGWQLDNYKKTGAPVLFGHDYGRPPIGNAIEMEIQRKGLWSVTRFHGKTQESRDLAALARDGIMKSWSVGFNPLEEPEMRKDEKGNFAGYIFSKQELLEYSLVSVPANPEAVSKLLHMEKRGLISHRIAAIIAGPSPLAEQDIAGLFGGQEESQRLAKDASQAKVIANYFLKGVLNGRRG